MTHKLSILLFCVSISVFARTNNTSPLFKEYQPGIVIVKLKSQKGMLHKIDAAQILQSLQTKYRIFSPQRTFETTSLKKKQGIDELNRVYTYHVDEATDIIALARRIASDPAVEYAQPNYVLKATSYPDDPLYPQIYQLGIVKAVQAWDIQKGDSSVVIAIIDTGVDWDHPDLAAAIWTNKGEIPDNGIDDDGNGYVDDIRGWDFVEATTPGVYPGEDSTQADNNPMDFEGHGTHCAGIAAGVTNNSIGIASLGGGCKIMPLRIGWTTSSEGGSGYSLYMSKAFVYAADNGASIASLSFSSDLVAAEGAKYAYKNGVVILNAAGNENVEDVGSNGVLGAQPWALSVASTNSDDNKASYSSYGKEVDICAPGGDFNSGNKQGFWSTIVNPSSIYNNQFYEEFQGTSMATPLVAALAGLLKSKHKDWTPAQIMFQIVGTADNIDAQNPSYIGKLGGGRINAYSALSESLVTAKPKIQFISADFDDTQGGNGNTFLDPGEQGKLIVTLENQWGDAHSIHATLSTADPAITISNANSSIDLLRGISNIDSSTRDNSSDPFSISVDPNAAHKKISFALSVSADGGYTANYTFQLSISPTVLVVDDDDGVNNIESYTTKVLDMLGQSYDLWDHVKRGSPTGTLLTRYPVVIWLCEWAFPALDSADRSAIGSYLDSGGNLFLSGQDIGWDLADPSGTMFLESGGESKTFFESYLKSHYVADDAGTDSLTGITDDPISNSIRLARYQPGRKADEQYPDVVSPVNGSAPTFLYSNGSAKNKAGAIEFNGSYKLVYFAFGGFESITDPAIQVSVMKNILTYFGQPIVQSVEAGDPAQPIIFSLAQNYPNPFNPVTTIEYSVPKTALVSLVVYDVLGRNVAVLVNDVKQRGTYSIPFDASSLSSGMFFYTLREGNTTVTKKMVLLK